jgi:UDP-glucose 4-epimerase
VPHEHDRPIAWVTGATSFLGRHVALALMRRGYDVVGFARSSHIDPELAAQWGFNFIECGAFDAALLSRAQNRAGPPEAVFHAIGAGSVAQANADPVADSDRTLQTTKCLLEHLCRTAPGARLIYPSSAAVYGATAAGPISEHAPTEPISVYGVHKLRAEDICRSYAGRNGLQTVIVRFFSVYGAPQRKLLFWDIGQRLLAGERTITLGGTGEETRDLIHVTDAARVVAALIVATNPPPLLNAGTGRATSVKTLVELLASAMGVAAKFRFDGCSRPGNPPNQQADASLLSRLGFAPSVPLGHGIAEYATWLRTAKG